VHPSHLWKIHPIKSTEVDKLLEKISPIAQYRYLRTVQSSSMISSLSQQRRLESALVAARDLNATFKLADLSWSPPQSRQQFILNLADNHHIPVVIDTGASVSLTPNASDFIHPIKPTKLSSLQGLGSTSRVDGQGIVEWQIRDVLGCVRTIRMEAYLVRDAAIRLFSPQVYFKEANLGWLQVDHLKAELCLHDGSILTFPYAENNLPYMVTDWQPTVGITCQDQATLCNGGIVNMSVAEETNQNLTASQKELLQWHWKLGHGHFGWIQRLASDPRSDRRRILQTKHVLSSADVLYCAACSLSKLKRKKPPGYIGGKAPPEMQIRKGDLQPGDCVSVDQYVSSVPGRLPHTAGKEKPNEKYNGGTIFVDHASSYIHLIFI
jgi:hypothetical protein